MAIESSSEAMDSGMTKIVNSLKKIISKNESLTDEEKSVKLTNTLSHITTTTDITQAKECDLVIEAIAENLDLKLSFYSSLSQLVQPNAVFASNTSSLPITAMGDVSLRPSQFIGLHFFNPVQIMKLVEVVRTVHTSDNTYSRVMSFTKAIGKQPVTCPDTPGFIVNRLLVPYLAQAMLLVDKKIATVADIDISMKLGAGHPMGPLHLADYIGLDTCHSILTGWRKDFPDEPSFILPLSLSRLVSQGKYGRKTGSGFYEWEGEKRGDVAE
eukprot:CAMPEP_0182418992 /NCGR_PEP_ID=MMETSP1167-20130531/3327_1 /TAXON_ID=2988 /ORGANISM="Mallomonas Sp, Strain CCMP3275" /LENGTH=269 /DNA_ID=CAMNT_0024593519 /DNA_START=271 /DNA_END=1080 /DNA_ORIENTATION=+